MHGFGHTLEELAIGRMEGSHILEAIVAVVDMRPAVKSSLGTMTPNQRLRRRRPGPRPPAIRRDRLPLVLSSLIEGMRLSSQSAKMPPRDPGEL